MPSLFRFLTIIAILGAIGWGIVLALAFGIQPTPREMVVPVPIPPIETSPVTPPPPGGQAS